MKFVSPYVGSCHQVLCTVHVFAESCMHPLQFIRDLCPEYNIAGRYNTVYSYMCEYMSEKKMKL